MALSDKIYVVYLGAVPIGVHQYPWMAFNEAKERSVAGKSASVYVARVTECIAENPSESFETKTDPDCIPCGHGFKCDDSWNPRRSGAV
jgi:hypothetical protein